MKNNNFKGFGSLGLQIIMSTLAISIGVLAIMSSTAGMEGEPPGKDLLKVDSQVIEEIEKTNKEEKTEEEIKSEDQPKQEDTVDASREEDNNNLNKDQNKKENQVVKEDKKAVKINKDENNMQLPKSTSRTEKQGVSEAAKPLITVKEETKTEKINYSIKEESDGSLEKGKKQTSQKGQEGRKTIIYKVTYTDGKETDRREISSTITKKPLDEIVKVGTKEKVVEKPKNDKNLPNNYSYSYKADLESRMINLINQHRKANGGLAPLKSSKDMTNSARYKSLAMLQKNYFGHNNPGFPDQSLGYLMRNVFGYKNYSGFGENIGYTVASASAIDDLFLTFKLSPGHNKNMLDPSFKYVGIGVVAAGKSGSAFPGNAIIITQHFGK